MAAQSAATLARIARSGMGLITPAQGLGALQNVLNAFEAAQLIQPEVTVSQIAPNICLTSHVKVAAAKRNPVGLCKQLVEGNRCWLQLCAQREEIRG